MVTDDNLIELDDGPRRIVEPEPEERIVLDLVDAKSGSETRCLSCSALAPVNDAGICRACHDELTPARDAASAADLLSDISQSSAANHYNADAAANGRATLGVGFSTAEGYIESLRRGVAPATLRSYAQTLRAQFKLKVNYKTSGDGGSYTMTVGDETFTASMLIMAPSTASVPDVDSHANDEAIAAMKARSAAKRAAKAQAKAEAAARPVTVVPSEEQQSKVKLIHGQLVAGSAAEGHGILVGWSGAGDMTRAQMLERIAAAGVPADWAFDAKEPTVQLTRAMRAAAEQSYNCEQEKKSSAQVEEAREWASRWMLVRRVVGANPDNTRVGQTFGEIALCVTLYTDKPSPELVFDEGADAQLVEKVRAEFEQRIGSERYQASDVTRWLAVTLKTKCEAVRYGGNWYVPKKHRATAEALQQAFKSWGADWMEPPLPIATSAQLAKGLANGLQREVDDELRKLEAQRVTMREKHGEDADVGETAAQNLMTRLRGILARCAAYEQLLGEECMRECHEKVKLAIAEVDTILEEDTKTINARFSNIWDEIKRDITTKGETL